MAANFDAVHEDLQALKQFCIRAGKQPYIRDGERKNSFTSTGWPAHRSDWLTFGEAVLAVQMLAKVHHNGGFVKVEGIGFLVARDGQDTPQTLGGDLDCCRDPATGLISPWATALLQKTRPFYTEVSPSKCGLRYFVWGRLPGGRNSVFANGPQYDLSVESRERILTAKPKAREKLGLGQPAFNGLELYESGRHLTLTGWKIEELCFPKEDQTGAISEALEPFLVVDDAPGNVAEGGKKERAGHGLGGLPHLAILDVIKTRGFTEEGNQLFGPHPTLGSTTGRNLVVNSSKNLWAYMHNGINRGGDPWIWLACECGAVSWPQAGAGVLKDRAILEKTLRHAVSRGLISDDEVGTGHQKATKKSALEKISERIPAWIEEHHFKTVSDTKKIFHYEHGVYLNNGETVLETLIEAEFPDFTNNKMVSDVIGKVKRRTYTDRDLFNNRRVVNVKNGLLDLETLQLQPHSPDYLSTAQIDVLYIPEATAPNISKFLHEVAQSGDVALIEEIIGWMLWPDYHIHKAVMLVGKGRNGKGTLLRLITAFLGRKSISNVTLQDLVSDTFAKSDLYGKLANIGGDLPSADLSDTSAFRNLTGGDDNRAQEKYRPAFNFRNKAKMLFSANVLPRSNDDTFAFYSRWILLEFLNRYVIDDGTADPNLEEKLQTPGELSGLLNIALAGLQRLRANGWKFSYTKTAEDVEVMYKRNANPVFAFLMDECVAGEATDYIEKSVFFDQFKAYTKKHNLRPMSTTRFGELLKDQTEIPVSNYRPWIERGDRPHCWAGVKFKTPLTKKDEKREKSTKPDEKGQKIENKTASGGLQSISSILKPYSTNTQEKNKGDEDEKKSIGEIEYEQTMDGMDCDPMIAVSSEKQIGSKISLDKELAKVQEQHFKEVAGKYTEKPDEHATDHSEEIRVSCRTEYGVSGMVDPRKIAAKLKVPLPEVKTWLDRQTNYMKLEREGTVFYTQKRAGEAA